MHLRLHVCAAAMPMNKSRPLLRSHGEPESLFIQTFMTFPHDRISPSPSPSAVHLFHQRVFPASSLTLLPISLLYRFARLYPLYPSPSLYRSVRRIFRALSSDHVLESVLELPRRKGEKSITQLQSVALRALQGDDKAGLEMRYRVLRPTVAR